MNNFKILLWTNYIIPHGITDFLIAYEYNMMLNMLLLYLFCFIIGLILNEYLFLLIFCFVSVIHFMDDINIYISLILILISLISLLKNQYMKYSINLITGYLSLVHIPLHYNNLYDIIIKYRIYFIFLILSMMIFGNLFIYKHLNNILNNNLLIINDGVVLRLLGSIIISHCIFNDMFMLNI